MKKLYELEVKKVIALYENGFSQREIGETFGVTSQAIGRLLRFNGIETCSGGWKEKRSKIREKHEEIINRYGKGESKNAIARNMKMSVSGVSYVIDKFNN